MSIIRVTKKDRFVTIDNSLARNSSLSWEARGLLLYLLSQASGWEVMEADLINQGTAGRDKIRRMLKELEDAGHFRRVENREGGQFRYITEVHESPLTENTVAAPLTEKPSTVKPLPAKHPLSNTNKINTKERKTEYKTRARITNPADLLAGDFEASDGLDVSLELEMFRDWTKAKGRRHKDAAAAFRNWLRIAAKHQVRQPNGQGAKMDYDEARRKAGVA